MPKHTVVSRCPSQAPIGTEALRGSGRLVLRGAGSGWGVGVWLGLSAPLS